MTVTLLWDPLFRDPLLVGLVLSPLAAVLGCWLRVRDEWLACLGYTHAAGAGGVLAAAIHVPMLPAAMAAACAAGGVKAALGRVGNEAFAVMLLSGWSVALLLAANHPRADVVGRVFLDGQILFASRDQLWVALGVAVIALASLPVLSPRLLRQRFQPAHHRANRRTHWASGLAFDLLVVLSMAVCSMAMGVMAAFAMVLVPAWIAWRLARGWHMTLWLSAGLAVIAYLCAFLLAILLDQPFGPVMVAVLLTCLPLRLFSRPGASV